MSKRLTTDIFIQKAKAVQKVKYDYSLVEYVGNKIKVEIICQHHGIFKQSPSHHLMGKGCQTCADVSTARKRVKVSANRFVSAASQVHSGLYSYEEVEYSNAKVKVRITCPVHGIFKQTPNSHLRGKGCKLCGDLKIKRPRLTTKDFKNSAKSTHAELYDYSLSNYTTNHAKIEIICRTHGSFWQAASAHLAGKGCSQCMKTGYRENKSGSFYVMAYENITKVGITNRCVSKRLADIRSSSGMGFTVTYFVRFESGVIPLQVEKQILIELRSRYLSASGSHDGYTECFLDVDSNHLLSRVSALICEALK